jgi:hypothetical protein
MVDTAANELGGIDPYFFWVLGEGRRYFFLPGRQPEGHEWMPLLLRLSKGITAQDFASGQHITAEEKRGAWQDSVRVSSLYTESRIGAGDGPYITAMVRAAYLLDALARDPELRADVRRAVESVTPGRPLDAASLPPPGRATPPPKHDRHHHEGPQPRRADEPAPSTTVVMGVIDDGIAFAHEQFRKIVNGAFESRVEHWWLQDGPFNPPYYPFTLPPAQTVPYGCELDRSQINNVLQRCTFGGAVDDDLFYRTVRLIDFQTAGHKSAAWRIAHGTHVMDLACGFDPVAAPADRPIIAVQLPIRVTADTSGASLFTFVVEGMLYILDRASTIPGAANAPVVINLSYGRFEGPHDGTADIELAIEALVAITGGRLHVTLPAGNSYLSRTHAQVEFHRPHEPPERKELRWRVLPDDRTPSFMEIWLPPRDAGAPANRLDVTIISPTGERHTITETSGPATWGNPVYAEARHFVSPATGRTMFRISAAATADLDTTAPLAPAGTWRIRLRNRGLTDSTVHAWIQRDDSLYGFPLRGRQSFFDDPAYVRFDNAGRDKETDDPASPVRRESTLNGIATGAAPVVVGGYLRKETVPVKYSSAGAHVPPPRWPTAMLVSEDSRVHSGVLAAGSHSGSVVGLGGTSVAAPQYARLLADVLAGVRAPPAPVAMPGTPPERSGAGQIVTDPIVNLNRFE